MYLLHIYIYYGKYKEFCFVDDTKVFPGVFVKSSMVVNQSRRSLDLGDFAKVAGGVSDSGSGKAPRRIPICVSIPVCREQSRFKR